MANSGLGGPNEPGPDDRFDDLVTTNLNGTYRSIRAFESHLAPGPEARHVVVIASILARIGVPGYTGYCASKAGLLGLVRSFAAELAPANVQVNAICPGWVDTDLGGPRCDGGHPGRGACGGDEGGPFAPDERARRRRRHGRLVLSLDAHGVTGQAIDQNNGAFML